MDQVLWLGKGAIGRVGLGEGDAAQALFADAPKVPSLGPRTCPYHPTFPSRSAPADILAVLKVAEHSVLFFASLVHQLEVTKDGTANEEEAINFAISGVAPPRPAHHTVAPVEHRPSVAKPQVHACRGMVHLLLVRV